MIIHSPIISGSLTFADGASLTLPNPTTLQGTFTGTVNSTNGVISGSSQVDADSITNFDSNVKAKLNDETVISGSSQVNADTITNFDSNVKAKLNDDTVVSGSSQIDVTQTTNYSSINQYSDTKVKTKLNAETVISGSSQVNHDSTTGFVSDEHIDHSTVSVTAGSGLTGGGTIAATRTINVGQGDGINVSADAVAVDSTVVRTTGYGVISGSGQLTDMTGDVTVSSGGVSAIGSGVIVNADVNASAGIVYTKLNLGGSTIVSGSASQVRSFINVEDGADVTDSTNVVSSLVGATGISAPNKTTIQSNLGVDPSGTDNSTDVTLAGSYDYLTISGQVITRGQVDASTDISNLTTANVSEVTNLYYTDTRVKTKLNAEAVLSGSTHSGNQTFSNDVTITGNLTVNGTTTSVNSNTVNIGDNIIVLNSDVTGTPTQNGGIELERGSSTNASITWDEGTDSWKAGLTGAEVEIVTISGTQTLTNKTISASQITEISNLTAAEGAQLENIGTTTISAAQWGYLGGLTATNTELNVLDGIPATLTATEIGYLDGVTSAIQTQLDGKSSTSHNHTLDSLSNTTITSNTSGEILKWNGTAWVNNTLAEAGISATGHTHTISDITDLSSGATGITSVGTIATGVWQGTAIADAYLSSNTAHLSGTQTFSGAKTFSAITTVSNATASTTTTTGGFVVTGGVGIGGALNVGGDVVAYASSDERLKDNIELISNPIEKVQSLKGVTWNWNDDASETQKSTPNIGVIAQDVEKVLPQLVHDRDNGFKGVDYAKLTGLLIEAIKDQQKQIDELKSKLS